MTQKQISKDNRIYWNDKIENKFDEKKEAVLRVSFLLKYNDKSADKQYPKISKNFRIWLKHLKHFVN